MKQHHYRITVEHLADKEGLPPATPSALSFEAGNHDELLGIVERIRARGDFEPEIAAAFALGLKLFGEVMLTHRDHPLFEEMGPQFGAFMKRLKGGTPRQPQPAEVSASSSNPSASQGRST